MFDDTLLACISISWLLAFLIPFNVGRRFHDCTHCSSVPRLHWEARGLAVRLFRTAAGPPALRLCYACATLTLRWHHPTTALQRYTFSPLFPLQSNITAVPVPCQRAAVPRARDTTAQRYTVNCFRGALCCSLKKLLCKFCFFNFFPKYFSPACISEWMAIWF